MQKENLIHTNVLLTMLKGYEKLMNAKERENFYKQIHLFSNSEEILYELEKELNEKMDDFEDAQGQLSETFDFIINNFKKFIENYNNSISQEPVKPQTKSIESKEDVNKKCNCKKDLKGFKEFLASKEGNELLENLFSMFNGEIKK